MDYLRDFMNSATTPSFEMIDLYSKVESARNALGVLETDHQQLERSLSGADWMFKEEEDEFYQYGLHELFEDIFDSPDQGVQEVAVPTPLDVPPMPPPPALAPPAAPQDLVLLQSCDNPPAMSPLLSPRFPPPPPLPPSSLYPASPSSGDISPGFVTAGLSYPTLAHPQYPPDSASSLPRIVEPSLENNGDRRVELNGLGRQFGTGTHLEASADEIKDPSDPDEPLSLESESSPSLPTSTPFASGTYSRGLSPSWRSDADTDRTANDSHLAPHVSSTDRRYSDPVTYDDRKLAIPQSLERCLSEDNLFDNHRSRATKSRVRSWLMGLLRYNSMDRTLYHNILEATLKKYGYQYPDHESWGEPASQYWAKDSRSSFETDPSDRSTTALDTIQELRAVDSAEVLLLNASHGLLSGTSGSRLEIKITPPEVPTPLDRNKNQDMDPTDIPLPSSPIVPLDGTVVSLTDEQPAKLAELKLQPSTSTLPLITIVFPQDDEYTILHQAASKPLPPSPIHLSCDSATWCHYRLDASPFPQRSEPVRHISYRDRVYDFIFPSKRRRSHSMSSMTRSREPTTYRIKRTLSKDRT